MKKEYKVFNCEMLKTNNLWWEVDEEEKINEKKKHEKNATKEQINLQNICFMWFLFYFIISPRFPSFIYIIPVIFIFQCFRFLSFSSFHSSFYKNLSVKHHHLVEYKLNCRWKLNKKKSNLM